MTVSLDWENLGFSYMKLPYRYLAHYRNGAWEKGELTEDATLHLSESSPSLQRLQHMFSTGDDIVLSVWRERGEEGEI